MKNIHDEHQLSAHRPSWRTLMVRIVVASWLCFAFVGCSNGNIQESQPDTSPSVNDTAGPTANQQETSDTSALDSAVKEKLDSMTLEEKVGQLFIVRPESLSTARPATTADGLETALQNYPVGGITFFTQNLENEEQTKAMISDLQKDAKGVDGLPLFTCIDEEGGTVARIGGASGFNLADPGNACDIGATGNFELARNTAFTTGSYLKELGFNTNFAPDSDVVADPASSALGLRSFGSDPQLVSSMVKAEVEGYKQAGLQCAIKHFPGIGNAQGDSHEQSIYNYESLEELEANELIPFEAVADETPFVMVGHLSLPNITGDNTPASVSPTIVTDLLRNQIGYDGIVITDSMEMSAVNELYTSDQVGVAALLAGDDIILMPEDFPAAYQGVLDAVTSGQLTEERIDESVERILEVKLSDTFE